MNAKTMRNVFLFAVTLCGACIPFPHDQQESPNIRGTLIAGGMPAANVTVHLVVSPSRTSTGCPAGSQETRTDVDGFFSFARTSYFSAFIIMGDRYDTWRICFDKPDGQQAIWEGSGFWGGPPLQKIKCDLDPSPNSKQGICSVKNGEH